MSTDNLKRELEAALLINNRSPTESELNEIARRIKSLSITTSNNDIDQIVLDVVGSYERMPMEGIDNTDLTTLLLMATKTAKK